MMVAFVRALNALDPAQLLQGIELIEEAAADLRGLIRAVERFYGWRRASTSRLVMTGHRNPTLLRGRLHLRQCQELTGHGLNRGSPIRGPQVLATAQSQSRCNRDHGLALTIELQCQNLPRRQHRRGLLGGLLEERSRRMNVGEGAPSKALACQVPYSRKV